MNVMNVFSLGKNRFYSIEQTRGDQTNEKNSKKSQQRKNSPK